MFCGTPCIKENDIFLRVEGGGHSWPVQGPFAKICRPSIKKCHSWPVQGPFAKIYRPSIKKCHSWPVQGPFAKICRPSIKKCSSWPVQGPFAKICRIKKCHKTLTPRFRAPTELRSVGAINALRHRVLARIWQFYPE